MSLIDVPVPSPGPGEVLVQVGAAGLNPVDVKIRQAARDFGVIRYTDLPGWDVAGTVQAVGPDAGEWRPGDRVFALAAFPDAAHTLADHALVSAGIWRDGRRGWSVGQAETGAARRADRVAGAGDAGVSAGQRVLGALAAGGVGHLAIQLAKARSQIATAGPAKHEMRLGSRRGDRLPG